MTNFEAIEILNTTLTIGEQLNALEMAIEELEQQPCEDRISRAQGIREILEIIDNQRKERVIQNDKSRSNRSDK